MKIKISKNNWKIKTKIKIEYILDKKNEIKILIKSIHFFLYQTKLIKFDIYIFTFFS